MIVFNVQFVFYRYDSEGKVGSSPQAEGRRSDNTIGECSIEPPELEYFRAGIKWMEAVLRKNRTFGMQKKIFSKLFQGIFYHVHVLPVRD